MAARLKTARLSNYFLHFFSASMKQCVFSRCLTDYVILFCSTVFINKKK